MENATMYEVLQLAINLEEEGQKFYEKYATHATGTVRETLLRLASDEQNHAAYFKSLYHDLKEKPGLDYLFEEEVTAYFKEYAVSAVFSRDDDRVKSVKEAVEEAITTEIKSIEYYEYLLKHALPDTKETLEQIIAEEQKHKSVLEEVYKTL